MFFYIPKFYENKRNRVKTYGVTAVVTSDRTGKNTMALRYINTDIDYKFISQYIQGLVCFIPQIKKGICNKQQENWAKRMKQLHSNIARWSGQKCDH